MRGLGLGLVLWALGATVASAAVVRIDVTGSATGLVTGPASFELVDGVTTSLGAWSFTLGELAGLDVAVPGQPFGSRVFQFAASTRGSAILTATGASDCRGLLIPLCVGVGGRAFNRTLSLIDQTFSVLALTSESSGVAVSQDGLYFYGDTGATIRIGDVVYAGLTSTSLSATFTSATISVVPLPASAPLVLAGLGALALVRRRGVGGRSA